jgi:hypothetical protein
MTTDVINGTLIGIYIDGTLIAKSTSCELSIQTATRNKTTKESAGWEESAPTLKNWSVTGDFLDAEDSALNFEDLFDKIVNRTGVTMKMSSEVSGDKYYQGSCNVTDLKRSAPMEDNTTGSYTLKGTGVLSKGTVS